MTMKNTNESTPYHQEFAEHAQLLRWFHERTMAELLYMKNRSSKDMKWFSSRSPIELAAMKEGFLRATSMNKKKKGVAA